MINFDQSYPKGNIVKRSRILPFYVLPIIITCCLAACNSQSTKQPQAVQCPQNRTTEMAPAVSASMNSPLQATEANLNAGEALYQGSAKPLACVECHGQTGGGNGRMANMFAPAPRNFSCSEVMTDLSDGQLFWIIKNGSIGTSMPAFDNLTDEQIWQLTLYLRSFQS